jgi:aryl-alcohol dehydrogenase-like predicted oxidoreductase
MQSIRLGNTGLTASVAGLGCGGYSRLGSGSGLSTGHSADVVKAALDLGITFFDTSPSYENEALVGRALAGVRHQVVLSTKFSTLNRPGAPIDGPALRHSLEMSLERLGTDYVDVYSVQSVTADTYAHCLNELLPTLQDLKREGKVRAIGLTEWFFDDTSHQMAERAVDQGCWDYLLLGFNLLNQSASRHVLPHAAANGLAVAVMFAVRRALSDRDGLRRLVAKLVSDGQIDPAGIDPDDPLGFLLADGSCGSIVEAAYRFCRHESEGALILTGTGNVAHLGENVRAINRGPLPAAHVQRLRAMFGHLATLTGQEFVDASGALVKKHVAGKPKGH